MAGEREGRAPLTTEVRVAEPGDVPGIASVHVRGWQHGYAGLLPQAYLDSLRAEARITRWRDFVAAAQPPRRVILVAVDGHRVCAFADIAPTRDSDVDADERRGPVEVGEVRSFYVDPTVWRRGVGRSLMASCIEQLVAAGYRHATLWVLAGNERALAFYRRTGWRADGTTRSDRVAGADVTELRFAYNLCN